ncbi:MAG TPA: D-cysteine desulfhydrase family protein [Caulobacteraceae bacterium]|nr:D-cysteine desulfhydrase family protein [Caulobacteraceae bacterium]
MKDIAGALSRFPRTRLLHLPTPLEPMERLGKELGLSRLVVKRDDCTGLAAGGNKTRKLEYEVGAALAQEADTVITTGAIQSNHCRQTAGLAARMGLCCHLVLQHAVADAPSEYLNSGNVLLDRMLGAVIHEIAAPEPASGSNEGEDAVAAMSDAEAMEEVAEKLKSEGAKPYIIKIGASTALGALGYAECAAELAAQAEADGGPLEFVVHATGSCGTQAGLVAGFKALGAPTKVVGVAVSGERQDVRQAIVKSLAQETLQLLGSHAEVDDDDVIVEGGYVGAGYGLFGEEVRCAVSTAARKEALLIEPVYTGKAMAGLIDLARKGRFDRDARIAYLHTGGLPGLFAYAGEMSR